MFPQNSYVDVLTLRLNEVIKVGPNPIKLEPFGEEVMTQTHTEERPRDDRGRKWPSQVKKRSLRSNRLSTP